jgi:zinc metalloprotease ZmpB
MRRLLGTAVVLAVLVSVAPAGAASATATGAATGAAPSSSTTGEGRLFVPNAIVALRDDTVTDRKDADYPALRPAYSVETLTHLDGSGYLRGDFADVRGSGGRAAEADLSFLYGRDDDRFEQTMAYYAVTEAQTYIQGLGFDDIQSDGITVKVDQYGVDNSYFDSTKDLIRLGKGGVDDAEDLEVVWHEYGHAIQAAQVDGYGSSTDADAIGEGFGDYWAATMSEPVSGGFGVPCIAEWDSISYTPERPFCLRRVDLDLTVEDRTGRIHHDGQIWSRALWDIHSALGRTTADTVILTAQYDFNPGTTFRDAALNTVDAARRLLGRHAESVVRRAFEDRGILR